MCWKIQNKEYILALPRRELSITAEQSVWVRNLTQGKLKAVLQYLSAPALDLARRKCWQLVSIWESVCEGRRELLLL